MGETVAVSGGLFGSTSRGSATSPMPPRASTSRDAGTLARAAEWDSEESSDTFAEEEKAGSDTDADVDVTPLPPGQVEDEILDADDDSEESSITIATARTVEEIDDADGTW